MDAIILIGHGSRLKDACKDMERLAEELKRRGAAGIVEICHLPPVHPQFPESFAKCVQQGATRVIVIPYFLLLGQHLLKDIPGLLETEARAHPHVQVILGQHLGYDDVLVDLVHRRIEAAREVPDVLSGPRRSE